MAAEDRKVDQVTHLALRLGVKNADIGTLEVSFFSHFPGNSVIDMHRLSDLFTLVFSNIYHNPVFLNID